MDTARRSPIARFGADRLIIVASLVALTLGAWTWLWLNASMGSSAMSAADGGSMPMPMNMPMTMDVMAAMAPTSWTPATAGLTFAMWWIMMLGMMIPSSLPAILLYARVQRRYLPAATALRLSALFIGGYLAAWGAFSVAATSLQWALAAGGVLSPVTMQIGTAAGAGLFAIAGLYQLTSLKHACLRHCRSPAEFLTTHRRPGGVGAFVTGAHHGLYCVGCCWLLMALLFVGGVMNMLWVATLAVLVLLEKLLSGGIWLARGSGVAMLAIAVAMLVWNA